MMDKRYSTLFCIPSRWCSHSLSKKRTRAARLCVRHRDFDSVFSGQQWNLYRNCFLVRFLTEIQWSLHCLANADRRKNPWPNFDFDSGLYPIYCFLRSSFGSIPARIHRNSWLQTNSVFYRCRWNGFRSLNISTITTWPCHYTIQMTTANNG